MQRVEEAYRRLTAAGTELIVVAERLSAAAVERRLARQVDTLGARQLLRDLLALDQVFRAEDPKVLPPALRTLTTVPASVLQWITDEYGLRQEYEEGETLAVPAARLAHFDLDGEAPTTDLVRVRVMAPAWRRGTVVIVPARVVIAADQP